MLSPPPLFTMIAIKAGAAPSLIRLSSARCIRLVYPGPS
jgi:hypothetical protein